MLISLKDAEDSDEPDDSSHEQEESDLDQEDAIDDREHVTQVQLSPPKIRYVAYEEYATMQREIVDIRAALDLAIAGIQRPVLVFEHNGKDLASCIDFVARNPVKWALKVVDRLFTKKELAENTMEAIFSNQI